jgi:hypothetical protein
VNESYSSLFVSIALNTTIANIILFVFDTVEYTQYLYGYGQDGRTILRSADRGETWLVTNLDEYSNVSRSIFYENVSIDDETSRVLCYYRVVVLFLRQHQTVIQA